MNKNKNPAITRNKDNYVYRTNTKKQNKTNTGEFLSVINNYTGKNYTPKGTTNINGENVNQHGDFKLVEYDIETKLKLLSESMLKKIN